MDLDNSIMKLDNLPQVMEPVQRNLSSSSVNSSITSSRNPSSLFEQRRVNSSHIIGASVVNPNQNDANPVNPIEQSDIRIEVVPPVEGQVANPRNPARPNSDNDNRLHNSAVSATMVGPSIAGAATGPTFAQRNPFLAKLFSGIVAVLAFPFIAGVSLFVTPVLMCTAFFSLAFGEGELAKKIGASGIAKVLWGDENANSVGEGNFDPATMFFAFMPILGQLVATRLAMDGAGGVYSRMLKLLGNVDSVDSVDPFDFNYSRDIANNRVNPLPTSDRAKIDQEKWVALTANSSQDARTKPFTDLAKDRNEFKELRGLFSSYKGYFLNKKFEDQDLKFSHLLIQELKDSGCFSEGEPAKMLNALRAFVVTMELYNRTDKAPSERSEFLESFPLLKEISEIPDDYSKMDIFGWLHLSVLSDKGEDKETDQGIDVLLEIIRSRNPNQMGILLAAMQKPSMQLFYEKEVPSERTIVALRKIIHSMNSNGVYQFLKYKLHDVSSVRDAVLDDRAGLHPIARLAVEVWTQHDPIISKVKPGKLYFKGALIDA